MTQLPGPLPVSEHGRSAERRSVRLCQLRAFLYHDTFFFSQFPELKTSSCYWAAESKSRLSGAAISDDVSKWWSWELWLCFLFFVPILTVDGFKDGSHTELYTGEYWMGSPVWAWENHKHVWVPPQHTTSVPLCIASKVKGHVWVRSCD